jgi:dipeptide/tripeptide permease
LGCFSRLEKFSAGISSNVFYMPLAYIFSTPSIPMICRFDLLMVSQRSCIFCSHFLSNFFFVFLWLVALILLLYFWSLILLFSTCSIISKAFNWVFLFFFNLSYWAIHPQAIDFFSRISLSLLSSSYILCIVFLISCVQSVNSFRCLLIHVC